MYNSIVSPLYVGTYVDTNACTVATHNRTVGIYALLLMLQAGRYVSIGKALRKCLIQVHIYLGICWWIAGNTHVKRYLLLPPKMFNVRKCVTVTCDDYHNRVV